MVTPSVPFSMPASRPTKLVSSLPHFYFHPDAYRRVKMTLAVRLLVHFLFLPLEWKPFGAEPWSCSTLYTSWLWDGAWGITGTQQVFVELSVCTQ